MPNPFASPGSSAGTTTGARPTRRPRRPPRRPNNRGPNPFADPNAPEAAAGGKKGNAEPVGGYPAAPGDIATAGTAAATNSNAGNDISKKLIRDTPELLPNYLAKRAGLNTDTASPFGAYYGQQVKNWVDWYHAAKIDQPMVTFADWLGQQPNWNSPAVFGNDLRDSMPDQTAATGKKGKRKGPFDDENAPVQVDPAAAAAAARWWVDNFYRQSAAVRGSDPTLFGAGMAKTSAF